MATAGLQVPVLQVCPPVCPLGQITLLEQVQRPLVLVGSSGLQLLMSMG